MDSCCVGLSLLDVNAVEPEVNIQLPTEVWSDSWSWGVDINNLDAVLSKVPMDVKSPISSQQISSEEWDSEEGSPNESNTNSFNSAPSSCDSVGHSFNSVPGCWTGDMNALAFGAGLGTSPTQRREKKPKKKIVSPTLGVPGVPIANIEEKDLDYKKYKTRLCRNWQQTGKCPYGEACVYAHGMKEVRGEQENEAVVTSLSKLADQLSKQMGSLAKLNTPIAPLRPLRYRKPKAVKKTTKGQDSMEQQYLQPQFPNFQSDMFHPVAFYGHPWGQA